MCVVVRTAAQCVEPNGTHCTCQNQELFSCPVPRLDVEERCSSSVCVGILCSCEGGSDSALCKLVPTRVFNATSSTDQTGTVDCELVEVLLPQPMWAETPAA
ncbi:hypothetical protein FVE85_7567 [Porphyridium purpureum]|uniref:Uncharacterized protein n=1 Tax=Porphyridium purpureum TaxID=35688 RepID=A0A5J4ZAC2_PORPP|nr:hypothetical protein FVE85_7567 [Porphyridium purpureum]|eukprot:POR9291..scf295_1